MNTNKKLGLSRRRVSHYARTAENGSVSVISQASERLIFGDAVNYRPVRIVRHVFPRVHRAIQCT